MRRATASADRQGLPANLVLNDINLKIERGATLGVIGESGSGKSTLARVIAGLVAPVRGSVIFDGEPLPPDLKARTRDQFRRIQIVFQNADTALNPAHTIERILARPLEFYRGLRGAARDQRIAQLLEQVRLPPEHRQSPQQRTVRRTEAAHQSRARARSRAGSHSVR